MRIDRRGCLERSGKKRGEARSVVRPFQIRPDYLEVGDHEHYLLAFFFLDVGALRAF